MRVLKSVADDWESNFFVWSGRQAPPTPHVLAGSGGNPGGKRTGRSPSKGSRPSLLHNMAAGFILEKHQKRA
jgi:hypothetical protein